LLTEIAIHQYNVDWLIRFNLLNWSQQKKFAYENLRRRTDNAINEFRKKIPQAKNENDSPAYIKATVEELILAAGFANELKSISE
jgi:hypothetical protein